MYGNKTFDLCLIAPFRAGDENSNGDPLACVLTLCKALDGSGEDPGDRVCLGLDYVEVPRREKCLDLREQHPGIPVKHQLVAGYVHVSNYGVKLIKCGFQGQQKVTDRPNDRVLHGSSWCSGLAENIPTQYVCHSPFGYF